MGVTESSVLMVILNLKGGLGNQLFQYAAGRTLAMSQKTTLHIFNGNYKYDWLQKYSLKNFNIIGNLISSREIKRFFDKKKVCLVKEIEDSYEVNARLLTDNIILDGYWQSEKYFSSFAEKIRQELRIISPVSKLDQKLKEDILSKNGSVAFHIRRGDYVSKKDTRNLYGDICTDRYYSNALKYIGEQVENPHIFVFSNDPRWVEQNVQLPFPTTYINHNYKRNHSKSENFRWYRYLQVILKYFYRDRAYIDLCLMSLCKNFIIANSSFSWWGAGLESILKKSCVLQKNGEMILKISLVC